MLNLAQILHLFQQEWFWRQLDLQGGLQPSNLGQNDQEDHRVISRLLSKTYYMNVFTSQM